MVKPKFYLRPGALPGTTPTLGEYPNQREKGETGPSIRARRHERALTRQKIPRLPVSIPLCMLRENYF